MRGLFISVHTDSEHDIENLIEKTEKEGEEVEPESGAGSLFSFAKVWSADKEGLEDMDDPTENTEATDSWAQALELIAARKATELHKEVTGRGVRRKAAAVFPQVIHCPQSGVTRSLASIAKSPSWRHANERQEQGEEQVQEEEEVQRQIDWLR